MLDVQMVSGARLIALFLSLMLMPYSMDPPIEGSSSFFFLAFGLLFHMNCENFTCGA